MTKDKLAELLPEPFKYFALCGGIIALWRGRTYTPDGKTIDYEDGKFMMCENHVWIEINNPFDAS